MDSIFLSFLTSICELTWQSTSHEMNSGRKKKQKGRRKIDILVLSDIHLGTYGCKAKELTNYLKSIEPKQVILNGDIVDIWQFSKRYWPKSHMKVLSHLLRWISMGIDTTYITGNHDDMLRKFEGLKVGNFQIENKMTLRLKSKEAWLFHGDVFDVTMAHSRWLARLGAIGYGVLILLNKFINFFSLLIGRGRISFSKRIKDGVKGASKSIKTFEMTATRIAADNGYDYVICGHIHKPKLKEFKVGKRKVMYLNSGDWVENMTALEYHNGKWRLFHYEEDDFIISDGFVEVLEDEEENLTDKSPKELFGKMLREMLGKSK